MTLNCVFCEKFTGKYDEEILNQSVCKDCWRKITEIVVNWMHNK